MIERLSVRNFKALRDASFAMRPLTIVTGPNSSGKSTLLQALLLSRAASEGDGADVPLNGGRFALGLGEAAELLNEAAEVNEIQIEVSSFGAANTWTLVVEEDRSTSLRILNRPQDGGSTAPFTYLSAERLGPRDLQEVPSRTTTFGDVGPRGEYSAHVLATHERQRVDTSLIHEATKATGAGVTLGGQAGLWLSEIVSPTALSATWLSGTNAATVRFRPPGSIEGWRRPANVGFGFSYALPIVVAGLSLPRGSTLVVENPEAHLHPAGQSAMGRFLARLHSAGVQCLIETHSDHVVNGIRKAVASRVVGAEEVVIHFLGAPAADPILLTPTGGLSEWPRGFFDQSTTDLAELSRARARP